jgi:hypothetical protein
MDTTQCETRAGNYLDPSCLDSISADAFQQRQPYPWTDISNGLTPDGYNRLRGTLPDVSLFDRKVAVKRAHGQGYHDRYILHYRPDLALSSPWREFIAELQGKTYDGFVRRLFGLRRRSKLILTFEWYYGWQGCAVSPHCDARRKLGTHIFYFNTEADWKPDWGGHILILDDHQQWKPHSAPVFDDLGVAASVDPRGNGSLLFRRTTRSWHGVRPLQCPPDHLRKLFIVTINIPTLQVWMRRIRGKDPDGYRILRKAS